MKNIYDRLQNSFGSTQLIALDNISKGTGNRIFLKLESRNPAFSVKDRIAYAMVKDALVSGKLTKDKIILEPTSGNTGIALAMVGASLGIKVMLVMPDTMSVERRKLIRMFGAELVLTPGSDGMKGAISKSEEILNSDSEKFFIPGQFENPANPKIHRATTGPEIYRDLGGDVDVFVAGVGTGGTISGTSQFLKSTLFNELISVAVEPSSSPAILRHLAGEEFSPSPHKIQGIGAGFIPKNLDLSVIDRVEQVSDDEAVEFARRVFMEEGASVGISSGANVAAAHRLASSGEFEGKNIVTIAASLGERYQSTYLFDCVAD